MFIFPFSLTFAVNGKDTFTRCNKYSSKLDISRSFIRIFAVIKDLVCSIIPYDEILGHGCPHSILLRDCPMSLSSRSRW